MTHTPEEIKKYLEIIPSEIKSAFYSVNFGQVFLELTKKYNLHIDQVDLLQRETLAIVCGLEAQKDFAANISNSLEIDQAKSRLISEDINKMIFEVMRKYLVDLDESEESEEEEEEGVAAEVPAENVVTQPEFGLNKDQILHEIENPIPTPSNRVESVPINLIESKMKEIVRVPKQEIKIVEKTQNPVSTEKKPISEVIPKKTDPYREPI